MEVSRLELVTAPDAVPRRGAGNWTAIGKWDGMHLAHRSIIEWVVQQARTHGGQSVVIGFHPLPMALLRPADAPPFLQTTLERADVLHALGVDVHLLLPFDREMADRTAREFVEKVLMAHLAPREVAVGFNFTFGRGGTGTAQSLRDLCAPHGVAVKVAEPVRIGGETVSSTAVRYLLAAGEAAGAAELLGRPFSFSAAVVPGDRLGRSIGFPTANLELAQGRQLPALGVYAVRAAVLPPGVHAVLPGTGGIPRFGGMLNLGWRPTYGGDTLRCEAHLFGWNGDLYGQRLQVEFVSRLRAERAFAGSEQLARQLHRDAAASRQVLAAFDPALPLE